VAPTAPAEQQIVEVGRRLLDALPSAHHSFKAVDDRAIDLTSRDPELRAAILRLVDVAPGCRSAEDLAAHLVGFIGEVEHPGSFPYTSGLNVLSALAIAGPGKPQPNGRERLGSRYRGPLVGGSVTTAPRIIIYKKMSFLS